MNPLAKWMLVTEVVVCFGPSILMLLVGLLLSPIWILGLFPQLIGVDEVPMWDALRPILFLLSGLAGIVGLVCIVAKIIRSDAVRPTRFEVVMALLGLAAIIGFNAPWTLIADYDRLVRTEWLAYVVFLLLPVIASLHLLWLALARKTYSDRAA